MVNYETVQFINFLNNLAHRTAENGIKPFSQAVYEDQASAVLFDDNSKDIHVRGGENTGELSTYPVVRSSYIVTDPPAELEENRSIETFYDSDTCSFLKGCSVVVSEIRFEDKAEREVRVTNDDADLVIIVKDGRWFIL